MRILLVLFAAATIHVASLLPSPAQDFDFDITDDPAFPEGMLPDNLLSDPPEDEAEEDSDRDADDAEPAEEPEPPGPLEFQLYQQASRSNLGFAGAVASLARIGRWQDVDQYLSSLEGRGLSSAEQAEMARRMGPTILMRMALHPELSEASRSAATALLQAAKTEAESPERLRRAITQLASESTDDQLAATRVLLSGGDAAVAELVAALVSDRPPAPPPALAGILQRLGDDGALALERLALYGDAKIRQRALESLVRVDPPSATADLITTLHAADATDEEVASAKRLLQQLGKPVPDRRRVAVALTNELQRLQTLADRTPNDDQVATAWSVDDQGRGVDWQVTPAVMLRYRAATDMASRLRRIDGFSAAPANMALRADLAYRVMVDPDWGDPEQKQSFRALYPRLTRADALSAAIDDALQQHDWPALVGLIRLIDETAPLLERFAYLRGGGADPAPLVAAADAANPRVRYEAALKVSQLSDSRPFAGSSRVRKTLAEMRSLGDTPTAILLETRSDVIVRQEAILQQLGFDVEVVDSVAQLQRRVSAGGDIRLIVAKTELPDLSAIEMIDLVRRTDRGREIPIVLYGPQIVGAAEPRWPAPIVEMEREALTPFAFRELLDRIASERRLPPLSPVDRALYAQAAEQQLATMAAAR